MTKLNQVQQKGFTLIELIAVIVILGILAATAIPKFVNTTSDARTAKLDAAVAALKSAATMTHGKFLINGTSPQTFEGVAVTFANGFPNAASIAAVSGIVAPDYTVTTAGTNTTVAVPGVAANCSVVYGEAPANGSPTYTRTATGC